MPSTRASKVTFSCLVLAAVVGRLPSALAQGAQPAPQPSPSAAAGAASFSAEVEQVLVDVVVTDKKGASIKDLTQPDFVVSEDGKPQSIVSFQAVEFKDPPPGERPARVAVSTNVGMGPDTTARTGRSFVIVFDDVHLTMFEAHQAKIAVAEFLQHATHESDRVTIVATGGAAWWSARTDAAGRAEFVSVLKRTDGRLVLDNAPDSMSDYEAMRIHTFGDNDVTARVLRRWESRGVQTQNTAGGSNAPAGSTIDDPLVTGRATEVYFQALSRNRLTLEMVERMLHALEGVQGRKSVVLVSRGFIYDPNMDEFKRVTQSSRRANAAVYFLNAKGLEGMPAAFGAEFGSSIDPQDIGAAFAETFEASEGADSMSVESGGFVVRNTNDLTKGLKRIADDSRYYYLLGYSSTNTKRDGRFRKIQVKVARKGVELRARKGYYARLEGSDPLAAKNKNVPSNVDQALQAALDSPFEAADVPLRMAALVGDETLLGKAQTAVVADIDVDHFALEQKDGRWTGTLEFLLVVAHRESGEFLRYDQQVDMKLLPATRERMRAQWFQLSRDFELAPGGYQAKLVVRDKKSGAVGTLMHNFEVPALEPWRVSSPLLTDMLQPDPPGEPSKVPRLQPVARRTFPAGATLWCSYEVYGAVKDKASGMPKVTADYVIRSAGGAEFTRMPPTVIKPTSLGHLSRLTGTKLEGATPGDYEFVITLKDELSGETMEVKEPFAVVAAGSPATAQAKTD